MECVANKMTDAQDSLGSGDSVAIRLGRRLKVARQAKGLSLDAIAKKLKLRKRHLVCFENGDYEDLPEPIYSIGFMRLYVDYLGISVDEAVAELKVALGERAQNRERVSSGFRPLPHSRIPVRYIFFAALGLCGLLYWAWIS